MGNPFDFEFGGDEFRVPVSQLQKLLAERLDTMDGNVAIVAGCYIIAYDKQQQKLVPLIPSEHSEGTHSHRLARHYSGEFPARTFELGLDLQAMAGDGSKVVLLVNDHQMFKLHDEELVPDDEADLLSAGELRQTYFHSDTAVPNLFSQQIVERGVDPEQVLFSLDRQRAHATDILPKRSYLISEKYLLNRFEDHTRHRLASIKGFVSTLVPHGPSKISYCDSEATCDRHLVFTDEGCGCTEIVLELGLVLANAGFKNLLMIVPNECHLAVNGSAQATMKGLRSHGSGIFSCLSQLESITVVSGLGWWLTHGPPTNEACIWDYTVKLPASA